MPDITTIRKLGTIIMYNRVSIEVNQIRIGNGELRYDIRKYEDGEHQFRGISLEEEAAKELFLLLGREFKCIPEKATIKSLQQSNRRPFEITEEQKSEVHITVNPIDAKMLVKNINSVIDTKESQSL